MTEPHVVLGVAPDASPREILAARRRLARTVHPDVAGGDGARMRVVNEAAEALLRSTAAAVPAHATQPVAAVLFALDLLPVEACELVALAAAQLGDVWIVDEPYHLEVLLSEPAGAGCTIELVPDAGGSTISVSVDPPSWNADVRDRLVAEIAALGAAG